MVSLLKLTASFGCNLQKMIHKSKTVLLFMIENLALPQCNCNILVSQLPWSYKKSLEFFLNGTGIH